MIKKLQRKFIIIAMGSLLLVMVILLGSINIINVYKVDDKLNDALKTLSTNRGRIPEFDRGNVPPDKYKSDFQMDEETSFRTRYFTVKINEDGTTKTTDTGHINAVGPDEAKEYAVAVINDSKISGYKGVYKYLVTDDPDNEGGKMVVFIYCKDEIRTVIAFLRYSVGVALFCFFLMFLLVSIFSKKAIKPIIETMEKQKQFITDAGHEIKTPITIISANADVLEMTSGKNEWISSIRNQTIRLDKLVKNLLMLSKMDEGNIQLVFSEFNLSETVAEAAGPFEAIAETQKKKFYLDIQPELKYLGDESSIHQLVSTLVDNAMKYSNEEGDIKVTLTSVKKGSKTGMKIDVYNTTEEIDIANLDRLFDRFYRADSSRSRDTGGYGIGLSIAKSIVDAHHGKISVKSEDGKSIRFTVSLS